MSTNQLNPIYNFIKFIIFNIAGLLYGHTMGVLTAVVNYFNLLILKRLYDFRIILTKF
jgi:hypothetical protein